MSTPGRPRLSVVICTYDMGREAPRTITSAAIPYQRGVTPDDYEVIVVDNGSPDRLADQLGPSPETNVTIVDAPEPQPSPAVAMNWAAREVARGDILLLAIDGARLFSDGLYAQVLAAHEVFDDALVYTLSWHLGPKPQMESVHEGYDQAAEDRLLAQHGWPDEPATLLEMSVLAGSSRFGFFRAPAESNAFALRRERFDALGGYDERFASPGGGLCNLEMFTRHATAPGARPVCLLSEGTFHQFHGGIATSGRVEWGDLDREHEAITGSPYRQPAFEPWFFGHLRPEVVPFLEASLATADAAEDEVGEVEEVGADRPADASDGGDGGQDRVGPSVEARSRRRWTSRFARFKPRQ